MFVLLIFCGQQGYVIFKDYKKVSTKLANADKKPQKSRRTDNNFGLFTAAVRQSNQPAAVKAPLAAEIEGIVSSDEAWLSFAVIKTPGGQKSYREGESLSGFNDAYIEEINQDNVVVNYEGTEQVLALKKPDYFRGGVESGPVTKSTKDAGADSLHLDDYLVLKPLIEKGQLEGYNLNPRNASSFYSHSGLQKDDVVVKINAVDMTEAAQAKSIIANWSKMKEAEVVVRRHAHLENIRVNVLNN
ncbi:TPA: type II secretion system protein GspC [Enterobacter cancerogenus]|uniref:type II secretion system protein GspC n=1 Tax=Enterobacter sp. TaxID=42895 RepID=UPI0032F13D8C|nr:type II secretion system protein GspC [Enterobacter cancerogenus]HDR2166932.1 type II secretion system protein GspC [Enterobacter cancerogenus]HDR2269514.1 type II secretion system protein GspC [Enterobacter cancerogenus]